MNTLGQIATLASGDFLERSRRYSFLLTLGFVLYAAYLFLPPNHARYATLQMGGHRGVYNSAWVGTLVALQTALFLSLAGFYVVKNSLVRDRERGVGELIASSQVNSFAYLAAKAVSNFLLLGSMVAVMVVAAAAMQLVRAEASELQPLVLLAPFLILTLPVMLVVAATAVLFESIRKLQGGLGNVIYYFLWTGLIVAGVPRADTGSGGLDLIGFGAAIPDMLAACARAFPDFDPAGGNFSMGFNIRAGGSTWDLETFVWPGIHWTTPVVLGRLVWLGVAGALTLGAAAAFDRFDPARIDRRARGRTAQDATSLRESDTELADAASRGPDRAQTRPREATGGLLPGSIRAPSAPGRLLRLVSAECRISLSGVSRWWWIVTLANIVACLAVPLEIARAFAFPFAWIWPLLIFSGLGTRASRWGTEALLHSAPRPLATQLPSTWIAGMLVAMGAASGMALRYLLLGDLQALSAWLAAAAFVPALALALGSVFGQSRVFEIVYLILWYVGPLNKFPYADFLALTPGTPALETAAYVCLLTFGCLGAAFTARSARLRR